MFGDGSAQTLAGRLGRFLAAVAADPDVRVSQVEVLEEAERARVLREWNDTAALVPAVTVAQLFAGQAAASPGAVAVAGAGGALTYAELDAASSRLARYLIGRGAGPERVVAIALPRGPLMITAVLAVVKAGAAYLPVDPGYPAPRVAFMLTDAAPALVITDTATAAGLPDSGAEVVVADQPAVTAAVGNLPAGPVTDADRAAPLLPAHPAYVIYTSGSTGTPKGVIIPHSGFRESDGRAGQVRGASRVPGGAVRVGELRQFLLGVVAGAAGRGGAGDRAG